MSIEDARTKLMALKDVLNHIEGINKAMDELPKLLITVLGIVAVVLGGYIAYIIIYVLTARSVAPQLQSWGCNYHNYIINCDTILLIYTY